MATGRSAFDPAPRTRQPPGFRLPVGWWYPYHVIGLERAGELIGVVLVTHDGRKGWINRLAVLPAHRRHGYAARLVAGAERILHEQGITVIAVLIETGNDTSLSLFQKLGYAELPGGIHYVSKRDSAKD